MLHMYKYTVKTAAAIVLKGATPQELEAESRRQTENGRKAVIFPSQAMADQWRDRVEAMQQWQMSQR